MHWWKVTAALLLCSLLLSQPHSPRQRRMTPFWRGVSLRPIGASCRDNSECLTMLCRGQRAPDGFWATYRPPH
uniref:Liver-expressed antimicrobial peptide 2 n=1 Tax=Zosterops lateralis melanops TaxID=1220523 RepID=A0A8D2NJB7_ZOSLA